MSNQLIILDLILDYASAAFTLSEPYIKVYHVPICLPSKIDYPYLYLCFITMKYVNPHDCFFGEVESYFLQELKPRLELCILPYSDAAKGGLYMVWAFLNVCCALGLIMRYS